MKRVLILILIILLAGTSFAHEEETDPGILPDSFLWGLDKAFDSLSLALTANNEEKAKKGISIAMERISELKVMIDQNKIEHSVKAKEATSETLLKVKENIAKVEKTDSKQELETTVSIESELDEVEDELKELKEVEIRIKIKGDLSPEKLQQLENLVFDLLGSSGELEVEIKNKKDSIKVKIKDRGEDADELEAEFEKKHGLADKKRAKAEEELNEVKEDLVELEASISEGAPKAILQLLNEAREKITNSENALAEGKFGEAFGQANAAKNILKNAEKQLEVEEGEELEIEAEIKDGFAKIEVELNGEKLKFNIPSTDREEIINQIANELGISVDEARDLVEFEDEELEEELKKLKKEDIPGEKPDFDKIFEDEEVSEEKLKESNGPKDKSQDKDNSGKYSSNGKSSSDGESKLEIDEEDEDDDDNGGGGGGY